MAWFGRAGRRSARSGKGLARVPRTTAEPEALPLRHPPLRLPSLLRAGAQAPLSRPALLTVPGARPTARSLGRPGRPAGSLEQSRVRKADLGRVARTTGFGKPDSDSLLARTCDSDFGLGFWTRTVGLGHLEPRALGRGMVWRGWPLPPAAPEGSGHKTQHRHRCSSPGRGARCGGQAPRLCTASLGPSASDCPPPPDINYYYYYYYYYYLGPRASDSSRRQTFATRVMAPWRERE